MCLSIEHRVWSIEIADFGLRIADLTKKADRGQLAAPRQSSGQAGRKELGLLLSAWCLAFLARLLLFEESLLTMPNHK